MAHYFRRPGIFGGRSIFKDTFGPVNSAARYTRRCRRILFVFWCSVGVQSSSNAVRCRIMQGTAKKKEFMRSTFQRTGISLPIDGFDDYQS